MRSNPEDISKKIKYEEDTKKTGKLKIFFGYAAGVGKTYAMLKAAHDLKNQGVDVVVGYVEAHMNPETTALLDGLEQIENLEIEYKGITLKEFDLDETIKRHPGVVLVDELAHTNAQGCRHIKRYQDIEELLNEGIDVYSTVNVQHIESLNDIVNSITGISVNERIPDRVFDNANQVELVDIEPEELVERLNQGKIYKKESAERVLNNFFTLENLRSLRAIALRRTADRINKISEKFGVGEGYYFTEEHILVCLSSSPSNAKIIRTGARMATAFNGKFTAIYVETEQNENLDTEDRLRLKSNMKLAEQLGAKIEIVSGEDIAFQIAEFAKLMHISKIVMGRSSTKRKGAFSKASFADKLIAYAPNIDIYIIPDRKSEYKKKIKDEKEKNNNTNFEIISVKDVLKSLFILLIATVIGFGFYSFGIRDANIITVYILGVLFTSIVTNSVLCCVMSSLLSVLIFNFLFTEPLYTFNAYDSDYPITFLTMFIAAILTGSLASKIKKQAQIAVQSAYRTNVLLETNQIIQQAKNSDDIIKFTVKQLRKLLNKSVIYYSLDEQKNLEPKIYSLVDGDKREDYDNQKERAVAQWVFKNNKRAGKSTSTLQDANCIYLAVRSREKVYGVIGISLKYSEMEASENDLVLSIIGECGLALEKDLFSRKKEEETMKAEKEELRANLLRSISHDLRTPLTSILGNAGVLIDDNIVLNEEKKKKLYSDIYDDSMWLLEIVENILAVTKIEDNSMNINLVPEVVEEVIDESLRHLNRKSKEHEIIKKPIEDVILAKMDSRLIIQVIVNIVDNAIKYTPAGSKIVVSAQKKDKDYVIIKISDNGEGIADKSKEKIFDMFYSTHNKHSNIADSRRGLGLGLALCKSIVNAHGGEIGVCDNEEEGRGSVFYFTLKLQEVNLYE